MRKYFVGIFIGFCLSFAVGAHAEVSSFVGRVIEGAFPVTYNAAPIGDGLVVDGTTYLPVRKLGDALGLTVAFDADLGVSLTKSVTDVSYAMPKEVKSQVTSPTSAEPVKPSFTVEQLDSKITTKKIDVWSMKAALEQMGKDSLRLKKTVEEMPNYQTFTDRLSRYESELADLEKQRAALQP